MASGDTLFVFQPQQNQPPETLYASVDVRNGHVVLDFDDSTNEAAYFSGIVPRHYSGGGIVVSLAWAATSAAAGNVRWTAALERHQAGVDDLDSDSFSSDKGVESLTATPVGALAYSEIVFSSVEADSIAAGEHFRVKIARDAAHVLDTLLGDAELLGLELKEL